VTAVLDQDTAPAPPTEEDPAPRRPGAWLDDRRLRRAFDLAAGGLVFYWLLQRLWPTPIGVVIQGVIIGSLTALVSFGIALIYKSNRVINFAQADLGVVPASLAVTLMTRSQLIGLHQVNQGISYWLAVPLALACAVVLGWFVERVVIRRFSRAPRLILMVVTIGLSQLLAGAGTAIPFFFGDTLPPQSYPSPFDFHFEIGPVVFHGNDLMAVLASFVCIAGLLGFLRFTNMGIAIRASAESSDRASLLGVNVGRTQNMVWILAAVLSTVAMILRAGILGLPIGSAFGPTILLRALAAAVIGRMENFGTMYVAACGLGIVETSIIFNKGSSTLVDPAVFVILIVALLVQRRRRESRVEDQAISSWQESALVRPIPRELIRLPEVRWGLVGMKTAFGAFLLLLPFALNDARTNLAAAVFIFGIIAVSLVMLTGWAGEISLGQMAFVGIGAAVSGSLNVHYHWDLTLTVLSAGVVGAIASVVIGLPALRIRGLFLAVTTMAFALATSSYLLDRDYFHFLPDNLSQHVTRFPLLGRLDISSERAFYYVCLGVLLIVLWSVRGLQRSRAARVLIATRENPRAAQAFGVSLTRAKLVAFAVSGFFASFAGGLFAIHQGAVGQQVFAPIESIRALTMVVIGGLGSIPGALLGAVFLKSTEWFNTVVPSQFRSLFTFAGSGVGLILVLWFLPGGLGSVLYRIRDAWLRRVANRRGMLVPSLVADAGAASLVPPGSAPSRRGASRAGPEGAGEPRRRGAAAWSEPAFLSRLPRRRTPDLDYASYPDLILEGGQAGFLSIRSLDVAYGPVQVLFGVDLEVEEGEVIALLGTNGAGKSTVLRAISGLTAPRAGYVSFNGVDLAGMAPHRVASQGIIQVPGGRGVFPSLTVAENLRVASWMFRRDPAYVAEATAKVYELFPILAEKRDLPAAALSGGQQQMLTLGMAFITRPRLLMIDELSLGLAPVVVESLLGVVRQFQAQGTTVILVEQSVNVALTVAQKAYFMEKGEIRFHGPTAELLERPDVLRSVFLEGAASVGDKAPARTRARTTARKASSNGKAPVLLSIDGLTKSFAGVRAIDDVHLDLHQGEILGIIGPNGAGKTTLFDLISGFLVPDGGTITYVGADITGSRPETRSRLGLARSFQDARLFGALTVHDAVCVALDRELDVSDPLAAALNLPQVEEAEARLGAKADELIEFMGLSAFRDKFVSELSTGSRRIVDLACQLGLEPKVILFDEPSSGIAQRETEALGPLLLRMRDQLGAALLVIEHDMPLVTSVSDRILALDLGQVVVEGDARSVLRHPRVVASYLGSSREVIERSGQVPGPGAAKKGAAKKGAAKKLEGARR
jgi:ABC-type branched-subunit amino acid transport system ATPase component/branched-subunit amino acid ABC-type transport system permease component